MYIAPQSREDRSEVLLQAIQGIHFGVLVISSTEGLEASHLPMLIQERAPGEMVLEGHVSRANPLWKLSHETPALAIFQGPQAYIHPGWYPTKRQDGRAVPTWNYIAVHVHGTLNVVQDESWLRRHLQELTTRNEADRPEPWAISDAPPEFIGGLLKGIVGLGLRLMIEKIEGNWKMGQKHPLENRLGAARGLAASEQSADQDVGAVMQALSTPRVAK